MVVLLVGSHQAGPAGLAVGGQLLLYGAEVGHQRVQVHALPLVQSLCSGDIRAVLWSCVHT